MILDKNRAESSSTDTIVGELFEAIHGAHADAAIQQLTEQVISDHLNEPVDLLKLDQKLAAPEARGALMGLLTQVVTVTVLRYVTRDALEAARQETGRSEATAAQNGAQPNVDNRVKRKELSKVYDSVYASIYALRHADEKHPYGLTVSQVVEGVLANAPGPEAQAQLAALLMSRDIISTLTNSLILAAKEKAAEVSCNRYSSQTATQEDKKSLVEFARNIAKHNRGYAVKLLLAYKLPFAECMNLIGEKDATAAQKQRLAGSLDDNLEETKAQFAKDTLEWFSHVGPEMSIHTIVKHIATEAFTYGGLGVDEVIAIMTSVDAVEKLHQCVKDLAKDILGISFEGKNTALTNRLDRTDSDGIVKGTKMVSECFAKFKQEHQRAGQDTVLEKLPALADFTAALVKAVIYKAKSVYQDLLTDALDSGQDSENIVYNLGVRMAQSMQQLKGPKIPTGTAEIVHQVVDDIERCGLDNSDAIKIVVRALTSAGYKNFTNEKVLKFYQKGAEAVLQRDAVVNKDVVSTPVSPNACLVRKPHTGKNEQACLAPSVGALPPPVDHCEEVE